MSRPPVPAAAAPSPETLIGIREVARRVGCSTRSVWRLVADGAIPVPARLGAGKMVRWRASAVERWIKDGCPAVSPPPAGR